MSEQLFTIPSHKPSNYNRKRVCCDICKKDRHCFCYGNTEKKQIICGKCWINEYGKPIELRYCELCHNLCEDNENVIKQCGGCGLTVGRCCISIYYENENEYHCKDCFDNICNDCGGNICNTDYYVSKNGSVPMFCDKCEN